MHTIALRKNAGGTPSIHEPSMAGSFVLDCDRTVAPDPQLWTVLQRALKSTGYLPLRQLQIEIQDSRIALRGNVPSFYLKQLAQSVIRRFVTGYEIENLVEVTGPC